MAILAPFYKALATNSTATGFAAKIPKATEPSGDGIHNLQIKPHGLTSGGPGYLQLVPMGTDGDNDTFDMRVYGWRRVHDATLWVPFLLADISVVLGNISGAAVGTGVFMADTITLNDGVPAGVFSGLNSAAEDLTSFLVVHTMGAQYIEFDFDLTGGQEGVAMNCLFALIDP
jgi:hypothetical protein